MLVAELGLVGLGTLGTKWVPSGYPLGTRYGYQLGLLGMMGILGTGYEYLVGTKCIYFVYIYLYIYTVYNMY